MCWLIFAHAAVGVCARPSSRSRARRARRSGEGAGGSRRGGQPPFLVVAGEAVAEAPGLGAGLDDVGLVGEPVDDGLGEPGVGEHLGPLAEGEVGGHDQRAAFVALGDDLEDDFGGALGQRQVAEFVEDDEFGARVAADDACELSSRLGLLQLVGQAGERREAHAPSLLAGADGERDREVRLAAAASP